jgi:hypothetical protein
MNFRIVTCRGLIDWLRPDWLGASALVMFRSPPGCPALYMAPTLLISSLSERKINSGQAGPGHGTQAGAQSLASAMSPALVGRKPQLSQ